MKTIVSVYRATFLLSLNEAGAENYEEAHEGSINEIMAKMQRYGTDGVSEDEIVLHSMTMTFLNQQLRK